MLDSDQIHEYPPLALLSRKRGETPTRYFDHRIIVLQLRLVFLDEAMQPNLLQQSSYGSRLVIATSVVIIFVIMADSHANLLK